MVRLGLGARIFIVLSAGYLLTYVFFYKSNFDHWKTYDRCQTLTNMPPPPVGFEVVLSADARKLPMNGLQRYEVCFRKPPLMSDENTTRNCSVIFADDVRTLSIFLDGPLNKNKADVEIAASRLGFNGEVMKFFDTPSPEFSSQSMKDEYAACLEQNYSRKIEKPEFNISTLAMMLAWIWGVYGIGRFVRGK